MITPAIWLDARSIGGEYQFSQYVLMNAIFASSLTRVCGWGRAGYIAGKGSVMFRPHFRQAELHYRPK